MSMNGNPASLSSGSTKMPVCLVVWLFGCLVVWLEQSGVMLRRVERVYGGLFNVVLLSICI
jgi:hypothetical protein